jgi:hypothetical protein
MLILLVVPVFFAVAAMHRYLQFYAPSNTLVRRVRAQRPRWRTSAAMAGVAGVLVLAMHAVAAAVSGGAAGWLNLVVLVLAWDAIKIGCLAIAIALGCIARALRRSASRPQASPRQPATNCIRVV